ncbi:MAG: glutaredoxin family protein [Deltaproteobacteria bacterium]|nr:glutaredoxin family protein [Deltaproteobacteria bacterium]
MKTRTPRQRAAYPVLIRPQSLFQRLGTLTLLLSLITASACQRNAPAAAVSVAPAVPFEVRADSADLTFFWFDEHLEAHAASTANEVPAERRERVRVDPVRPELRAPGYVYVADLRALGPHGHYTVRTVGAEQFAQELRPAPVAAMQPDGQPSVVLYGASWCGACHQAAAWMRAQGIPFVEHDIEREPEAAREMGQRAREQGVPTGSIPIISVRGRLMVGFNPEALNRMLGRS